LVSNMMISKQPAPMMLHGKRGANLKVATFPGFQQRDGGSFEVTGRSAALAAGNGSVHAESASSTAESSPRTRQNRALRAGGPQCCLDNPEGPGARPSEIAFTRLSEESSTSDGVTTRVVQRKGAATVRCVAFKKRRETCGGPRPDFPTTSQHRSSIRGVERFRQTSIPFENSTRSGQGSWWLVLVGAWSCVVLVPGARCAICQKTGTVRARLCDRAREVTS